MNRIYLILFISLLCGWASANQTQSPLEVRLKLQTGTYSTASLVQVLENEGIAISFPSAALRKEEVKLETGSYRVEDLMDDIFDGSKYRWMARKGKILVVPQSHSKVKTYSGFIEEFGSQERLVGVNIYIPSLNLGTTTNSFGYYSLSLPGDRSVEAVVSFIGYQDQYVPLDPADSVQQDFVLKPVSEELAEVEVTDKRLVSEAVQMSEIQMSPDVINDIPALLGEVDVLKALQLMPGVQSGTEGSSGLYVRGGSPDQNLILLDGVPVYNVNHLFGFFSVFNADAIKNVSLTKGGFPARYGGRLSSVVCIDMKEGNMEEFHGSGSLGLLAAKATLEGPLVKGKSSFIISGRRTYLDLLAKPFRSEDQDLDYHFHDINAKVNHRFSRKDRLYLSFYSGVDDFGVEVSDSGYSDEFGIKWGNYTGAARWNHIFNNKTFGNLTATFSQYKFTSSTKTSYGGQESSYTYFSRIRDYGLRYDLEYHPMIKHKFRMGLSYTRHKFKPGAAHLQENSNNERIDSLLNLSSPMETNDIFAYAEDEWQLSDKWKANLGLHYSLYSVGSAFYQSLQPRLSLRYMLGEQWSLKGSYAQMTQYIHMLTNSGIGLPTDLWVSSTEDVAPQFAQQVALGTSKNILDDTWEISAELYYKWMNNLIAYEEGASFLASANWERNIETDGTGKSYGLELFVKKSVGKTTGWVGYTLARSTRQFTDINGGQSFPYRYDRRHDLSLVLAHRFSEKFDVAATWVYGSGNAFTAPVAQYALPGDFGEQWIYTEYTDRNSERLPSYHRLDLGVNFHKKTKWGERTWNISLYNAYSRQNPFFLYLDKKNETRTVRQVSLLPLIPSVSYIFKF